MWRAFLVIAACGPAAAPPVVKNERASSAPATAPGCPEADLSKVPPGAEIFGVVCDQDGTLLEGTTIIATSVVGDKPATIADARGVFFFTGLHGLYWLTFYYADCKITRPTRVVAGAAGLVVQRIRLNGAGDCIP
jgi:hypothetical protein